LREAFVKRLNHIHEILKDFSSLHRYQNERLRVMTVNIDLKPLSEELIKQMGYDESNLWLIKIGTVVFGPFETQTLKHYVKDNEHLFEKAEASLVNETIWKPFWSHTKFERRKLQVIMKVNSDQYEGPFWIIDLGLKTGPFTHTEINKKIEMGLMSVTDHISIDNGNNWIKLYQIKGFDRRTRTPEELPMVPSGSSFDLSEEELTNIRKSDHQTTITQLTDLTWQGIQEEKTSKFNLEEMNWKKEHSRLNSFMKWAIPSVMLATLGFGMTSIILFSSLSERNEVTENNLEPTGRSPLSEGRTPASLPKIPRNTEPDRNLRSIAPTEPHSMPREDHLPKSHGQGINPMHSPMNPPGHRPPQAPPMPGPHTKYPTQVITHQNENLDPPPEEMIEPPEITDPPEASLMGQDQHNDVLPEEDTPPPPHPGAPHTAPPAPDVVEENSDF
jgi:hypothetical protein